MIRPRRTVEAMPRYDPPLEGRRGKLRLDFNENTRGPSPKVLEALASVTPEAIATYPEYKAAYGRFAAHFGVDPAGMLATNGTDEAIRVIFATYIEEGDTVVLSSPTYALFEIESALSGADVRRVMYNPDLSFPDRAFIEAARGARMAVVVTPNNPTGTAVGIDTIRALAETCEIVLVDEAYYDFNGVSALPLLAEYDNIIVTRTFSKAYGLAGMRLGFAFASPDTISTLRKVASPYSVNTLVLACALATLDDQAYIDAYIDEIRASRTRLIEGLRALGYETFDSCANFVVCRVGPDATDVARSLEARGILVRDRSSYPLLEGCIRISVGTHENTAQVLAAMGEIRRERS